jgi:CMP-N,N'-diacetyllegionaminic acid synthase
MKNRKVLGLIPARGGSKGVPRKNIRMLGGLPLIAHTIQAALGALQIDRVIVSTDDAEIAEVARQYKAEVPFIRPAEFATDTASSISVVHHAIQWLEEEQGYRPDAVAVLAPTSPLRTVEHIDAAISLLWEMELDSAATVTEVRDHPYFIYSMAPGQKLKELVAEPDKPLRRQDLPLFYTHSQAVFVSRLEYLRGCGDPAPLINFASVAGLPIDRESALDIDTFEDLQRAETILRNRNELKCRVA